MPLTVRLSAKTERILNALARRRRLSRSDVVREAIAFYDAGERSQPPDRPYDGWIDAIGVIDSGVRTRARTTGEQFAALLHEDARARRAR